ncbi:MAG: hypothetical protein LC795_06495 [Acidobacteria bacterium]|nr:hypothetical protein [Acidobacteriota bacterium]
MNVLLLERLEELLGLVEAVPVLAVGDEDERAAALVLDGVALAPLRGVLGAVKSWRILISSEAMKRTTNASSPGLLPATMVLAASTTWPIWLRKDPELSTTRP